ncbi:MAG: hypothetical protein DME04_02530 [Candidatus Rokuibacteriota bacterium]|nr:MAG: hypothetical protein DME04_02530 [Candidatus Rokubacteria bacterium]
MRRRMSCATSGATSPRWEPGSASPRRRERRTTPPSIDRCTRRCCAIATSTSCHWTWSCPPKGSRCMTSPLPRRRWRQPRRRPRRSSARSSAATLTLARSSARSPAGGRCSRLPSHHEKRAHRSRSGAPAPRCGSAGPRADLPERPDHAGDSARAGGRDRRRGPRHGGGAGEAAQGAVLPFCLIGAYSVGTNVGDGVVMWVFGIVGYLMKKFDYEGAPLILAMVIGPMMEEALRQSLILSTGSFAIFVTRPISAGFILASALLLLLPLLARRRPSAT